MSEIASSSKISEIIKKYDFSIKKSFGQNFLIDNNITKNIVDRSMNNNINKIYNVLEIGPGIGSLSYEIAKKANKLVCIEIDKRLEPILNETLDEFDNVDIIFEDFLKIDLEKLCKDHFDNNHDLIVIANLPYYITTAILIKLFESAHKINLKSISAMMQKEVGDRLNASINTKDYNSLSILTQYYSNAKILLKVSKNVFIPKPNVDSVVVKFDIKDKNNEIIDEKVFFKVLRTLFKQRRKTILNNLNSLYQNKEITKSIINKAGLDENSRAESLNIQQIIQLSNIISREE